MLVFGGVLGGERRTATTLALEGGRKACGVRSARHDRHCRGYKSQAGGEEEWCELHICEYCVPLYGKIDFDVGKVRREDDDVEDATAECEKKKEMAKRKWWEEHLLDRWS